MKKIFYTVVMILSCGCATRSLQDLPGKYTCQYQNEFYKVYDTLIVQNNSEDVYRVERHTGIGRKVKIEKWTLAFGEGKNVLHELRKGKFVVVMNGNLIFGNRTYKKITP